MEGIELWAALLLNEENETHLIALRQDIFVEIAEIEAAMDSTWAGSLDLKQSKRHIRGLIVSLVSL